MFAIMMSGVARYEPGRYYRTSIIAERAATARLGKDWRDRGYAIKWIGRVCRCAYLACRETPDGRRALCYNCRQAAHPDAGTAPARQFDLPLLRTGREKVMDRRAERERKIAVLEAYWAERDRIVPVAAPTGPKGCS